MQYSTLSYAVADGIALVELNRPNAANSIDLTMSRELLDVAERCTRDPRVRTVLLGARGKVFCFGGDLKEMVAAKEEIAGYLTELTGSLHAAIELFTSGDAPVIAAVNGTAAGAGIGLLAMADLVVAARSAKFSLAYTGVALSPDAGCSYFLPRQVGHRRALELLLTNRALTAEEACAWGLVNEVVGDDELGTRVRTLAGQLADGPVGAFGATKRLIASSDRSLPECMAQEARTIATRATTAEGREGMAAFLEKRKPRFVPHEDE